MATEPSSSGAKPSALSASSAKPIAPSVKQAVEPLEFYAACPAGFEPLVSEELKQLNIKRIRPLQGGVAFFGALEDGLRACLWLRCASRVLLVLSRVSAATADALYDAVFEMPWQEHINPDSTIAVSVRGTNAELRNTQFTALKVKDAICDKLREVCGVRPEVSKSRPDVPIQVTLHAKKATVSLDLAEESLHKRGYREEGVNVQAPLKEALAVGVLATSPWGELVAKMHGGETQEDGDLFAVNEALNEDNHTSKPDTQTILSSKQNFEIDPETCLLYDPFCGSGTLVLEAAMMAADMAPGILRDYWGFTGWKQFDQATFSALLDEADARLEAGLARMPHLIGSDIDPHAIEIAQKSAQRIGLANYVSFVVADCAQMDEVLQRFVSDSANALPEASARQPKASSGEPPIPLALERIEHGVIVGNPLYGVRLMAEGLEPFYSALNEGLSKLPKDWTLTAISPDPHFGDQIGAAPILAKPVFNGAIETSIRTYKLSDRQFKTLLLVTLAGRDVEVRVLSDHPDQFAARLRKNAKARKKWAEKHNVFAFRLYDADLPDYAVSIDLFITTDEVRSAQTDWQFDVPNVLVSEYQAPRSIDANKAYRRFEDAVRITSALLDIPSDRVFTRVRKQARGGGQYGRTKAKPKRVLTRESGLTFELDLESYLDVGLFLDHRITRQLIAKSSQDKDVLNLFAYTGSASVYAAAGGAKSVTTVDLSQTYLDWAKRNMALNGFTDRRYRFIKADARQWIRDEKDPSKSRTGRIRRYDLIFIDPPTFSNSKSMGKRTWDIQRDHFYLLRDASKLLRRGGTIIFSGNLRSFKLDEKALVEIGFDVLDISAKTIPEDFARNQKIHFCYVLKKL